MGIGDYVKSASEAESLSLAERFGVQIVEIICNYG
jgi:hypothetical protein